MPEGIAPKKEKEANTGRRRAKLKISDLCGIVPALPGRETGDFDDLIAEAFDDWADQYIQRMKSGDSLALDNE